MSRICGQSYKNVPDPLLGTVGGKQRRKLAKAVPVDAPPLSSEDEDDGGGAEMLKVTNQFKSPIESDDSGDERTPRASTKRIHSSSTKKEQPPRPTVTTPRSSRTKRPAPNGSKGALQSKRQKGEDDMSRRNEQGQASCSKFKNSSPYGSNPKTTDHPGGGRALPKKASATYSKRGGASQDKKVRQGGASQQKMFQVPDSLSSPEGPKKTRLQVPSKPVPESPSKNTPVLFKKHGKDENDEDDSLSSPLSKPAFRAESSQESRTKGASRALRESIHERKRVKPEGSFSPPPSLLFKMPVEVSQTRIKGIRETPALLLSDGDSLSDIDEGDRTPAPKEEVASPAALCPWCGDAVDGAMLEEFSKGKRLNVRMQTRFCHQHKKRTAMDVWDEKQYPQIQWYELEKRFAKHRKHLLGVVDGGPSHFRDILAKNIETGKARSMEKEDNLNPGYYGPRGFNLMCDYLVGEFSDLLKEKAIVDKVIAGRGSAAFIQAVLVAELAVQLIQEDMNVSADEATDIMKDSKSLGEMIHEEL